MRWSAAVLFSLAMALSGCGGGTQDRGANPPETFLFTFDEGSDGWQVDFADYPAGASVEEQQAIDEFYELDSRHAGLPQPLETTDGALMISGNNHSDDLFMFLKRRISGLQSDTSYRLDIRVVIATNVPSGCAGVGGSPGEGVYIKGGAATIEPMRVVEPVQNRWIMNIDKGQQSVGGADAQVLGDFANSRSCESGDFSYELKTLSNTSLGPVEIRSGVDGTMWLLLGTDSAFEAVTTIYYTEIEAVLWP